jgi:pilus assembly protein TadC
MLLAAALLLAPGPVTVRRRAGLEPRAAAPPRQQRVKTDPIAVASSLDVFAVCLTAGMAVPAAAAATARAAPPALQGVLRHAADMLALGAEPAAAWSARGTVDPHCESLLRLARRSAASGAALAEGVAKLAVSLRHEATETARAAAERASVLIAGPLGLCYLPAFVCLGIVPVIAGLAGQVLGSGLL